MVQEGQKKLNEKLNEIAEKTIQDKEDWLQTKKFLFFKIPNDHQIK